MIDDFRGGTKPPLRHPDPELEEFFPDLSEQSPQPTQPTNDSFRPPEVVAAEETIDLAAEEPTSPAPSSPQTPRGPKQIWRRLTRWFGRLHPWQQALIGGIAVLALVALILGVYTLTKDEPAPAPPKKVVTQPKPVEQKPTTVASTLTGRQVAPEINQRQVTAVMIENSTDARPQGGLQQAGVVFEAIAEGGITRFVALYQDTDAESIGPVRSVRPYYISWAQGFDAAIAHVGGSPEALQIIRDRGVKDLDQSANGAYFQRVTFRYAPHNVFTSTAKLRELQDKRGYTGSAYTGFIRASHKSDPVSPITAGNISVNISSQNYASGYSYDVATNSYGRTLAGSPHNDIASNTQIKPDVVIVMVMNYSIHPDGIHSVYNTIGSGQVYVFQNGGVTTGTWSKTDHTAQITFSDANGNPIPLNPGQTWITAVGSAAKVSYTP